MRVREALVSATRRLAGIGDTPRLDAELLMAHALGVSREDLLLSALDASVPAGFDSLLARRLAHEPVAYITGRRAFWTIELAVGPGVLIPRPDSETLIEAAVDHFGDRGPPRILDLGTGPGTLLLAALDQWPGATGLGIDASEEALAYARRNAVPRARVPARRLGRGAGGALRPGPLQPALCRGAAPRCRPRSRAGSRPAPSMPAPTASTPIGASPRASPGCSRRAGSPASRSARGRSKRCARCSKRRGSRASREPTLKGSSDA